MKKLLLSCAVSCCAALLMVSCQSERGNSSPPHTENHRVSIEQAIASVNLFLNQIEVKTRSGGKVRHISECYAVGESGSRRASATRAETLNSVEEPLAYVLNFANDEGYAIVAADDRMATDIFVIMDSGHLNPDEGIDNPGAAAMFGMIAKIAPKPDPGTEPLTPVEDEIHYGYGPWGTTTKWGRQTNLRWGQKAPFNAFCPNNNPAGCVPVAVALLCAWYKFPANLNGQYYNWTEMCKYANVDPNVPAPADEAASKYKIAYFIEDISSFNYLNVNHSSDGTSASSSNIPHTLRSLGFSNGGTYNWDNYSTAKIYEELRAGYPVLVDGQSEGFSFLGIEIATGGGHQWLIDELIEQTRAYNKYVATPGDYIITPIRTETRLLVHCNMGWGGRYSGYYFCGTFDIKNGIIQNSDDTIVVANPDNDNLRWWLDMVYGIRK